MKKTLLALMLLGSCISLNAQSAHNSLEIGSDIPMTDVEFTAVNKNPVSLSKARTEKGLIVMFSCNTCPFVVKAQERTREVMKYAADKDVGMVIVNSNEAYREKDDAPEAMKSYATKQRYTVPYLIDEKSRLADAFGATRTPEVFLFDGNGKLVYKGAMEDSPSNPSESKEMYLKSAIDNMLSGRDINPASTKSIGCSIKRLES